jgi:hypothetical protein
LNVGDIDLPYAALRKESIKFQSALLISRLKGALASQDRFFVVSQDTEEADIRTSKPDEFMVWDMNNRVSKAEVDGAGFIGDTARDNIQATSAGVDNGTGEVGNYGIEKWCWEAAESSTAVEEDSLPLGVVGGRSI